MANARITPSGGAPPPFAGIAPQFPALQYEPPPFAGIAPQFPALQYEPLCMGHLSEILAAVKVWRGPHRNAIGGPWTTAEVEKRVRQSHEDLIMRIGGQPPSGCYWIVRERESGKILGIVGLHRRSPGVAFYHRTYLRPNVSRDDTIRIVRDTVRLFAKLNPREKVVVTTSPSGALYKKAGFTVLSDTYVQRRNSSRVRRMCFLALSLAEISGPRT